MTFRKCLSFSLLAIVLCSVAFSQEPTPSRPLVQGVASAGATSPTPLIVCDKSATISVPAAATTQVIALVAAKTIYVCGFVLAPGTATGTVGLTYGTGANCATGPIVLMDPISITLGTPLGFGAGMGVVTRTAVANALCVVTGAGTSATGMISYAQF